MGGALGGASVLADVAAPGFAPLVDLGLGAATAWLAADAAWSIAARDGRPAARGKIFVESVRAARTDTAWKTPAAAILDVACEVVDHVTTAGEQGSVAGPLCKLVGRLAMSSVRWILDGHLADLVPGVATVFRATRAARSIADGTNLVAAIEQAAEKACKKDRLRLERRPVGLGRQACCGPHPLRCSSVAGSGPLPRRALRPRLLAASGSVAQLVDAPVSSREHVLAPHGAAQLTARHAVA